LFKTNSYKLGVAAEKLVATHFQSLGFSLISTRYKTKYGEIDLIVTRENLLIFVEVKARTKPTPLDNLINQRQIDRNYAAAEFFLAEFPNYSAYRCRFDLVVVCKGNISQHITDII